MKWMKLMKLNLILTNYELTNLSNMYEIAVIGLMMKYIETLKKKLLKKMLVP
jgi:hypothetical protein